MILTVQRHVHDAHRGGDPPPVRPGTSALIFAVEVPPSRALGDLAVTVAFQLARAAAEGAARDRAGTGAGASATFRAWRASSPAPNGYLNLYLDRRAFLLPRVRQRGAAGGRRRRKRRSSSTRPSIPTRRRTSVTCGTRRSATRSCACCVSAARRWRCRTTSTTPACRSPTSSSASCELEHRTLADGPRDRRHDALRLLLLGSVFARHGMVRATTRRASRCARATLHDLEHGGNDDRRDGAFIVDRDRPRASGDDGAAEHRLRPADLRGRHPAAAVLGARVRDPQGATARCSCRPKASSPAAG